MLADYFSLELWERRMLVTLYMHLHLTIGVGQWGVIDTFLLNFEYRGEKLIDTF